PAMITAGIAIRTPYIRVSPMSAPKALTRITGPGCGGRKQWVVLSEATVGMARYRIGSPVLRASEKISGTRMMKPALKYSGMPTRKPVSSSAHWMFFSPKRAISTLAIFCAAPLSSSTLPRMAPSTITRASPARVLPTPLSTVLSSSCGDMPRARPIGMATISSDRNGLSLRAVRKICSAIATAMIRNMVMAIALPGDGGWWFWSGRGWVAHARGGPVAAGGLVRARASGRASRVVGAALVQCSAPGTQQLDDPVHVVDAAAPGAATGILQRRPQAGVGRQARMRRDGRVQRARGQQRRGGVRIQRCIRVGADEVDAAVQAHPVDLDAHHVTVAQAPDRPAGQCLRADMADACAGGHAGEARIGDHRHVLAPGQVLERGGELVGLLHAGAGRAAACQPHDLPGPHRVLPLGLDRADRVALGGEHARRAGMPIHVVRIDDRWIDGGGLDHRTVRRQVAAREHQRAGHA